MDLDSKEVVKKIEEYRKDYSCSQSTLMGICEVAGFDDVDLVRLGKGFSGGIGGTFSEGTCGAVTGAIMALGNMNLLPADTFQKRGMTSLHVLKYVCLQVKKSVNT